MCPPPRVALLRERVDALVEVVGPEAGLAQLDQLALAPLSQRGNKRVIGELLAAEGALDPETERELVELREACFRSDDFYEGVRAFAEKRAPRWEGR